MNIISNWVQKLLEYSGVSENLSGLLNHLVILLIILLIAYLADLICRQGLLRLIRQVTQRTKATWDDLLFNDKVMNNFCHLIPPVIIYACLPLAFPETTDLFIFLRKLCMIYIIAVSIRFTNIFLGTLFELINQKEAFRERPLKGIFQIIQVALFFVGSILIISVLIGKSPAHLLAGLGASAAILMLVFKDSIMGLVSGVQLSANDMLRPGDWITMPKYNADGVVIEVTLNTVKVRNFDNTITTIPPYALVSDSFQNWRGMSESEGRRIKRSINIDMNTVHFCTPEMLEKFKKITILKNYIEKTEERSQEYNQKHHINDCLLINGLHQTNLGVFRAYLENYLRNLPVTSKNLTHMVRQLQPTEKGIPLEIYFFSSEKNWVPYENIQSDIFDHILAIIPEFGLRVFQNPSSADIREVLAMSMKGSNI